MHITVLPEELFEEIFSYLKVEDILSCCLVCKSWRNTLNTNRIWFNLCSQRLPVTKNNFELIQAPLLVDPVFISPTNTSPTLTEICPWRLRFMQEAHLSRNWRFGRYIACPVARTLNPLCTECDDDALVILSMERREFSCYSINSIPKLMQTTRFSLRHMFADFFKLAGGKLVVAQCTLLQVFSKTGSNDEMFELTHRFLFNKGESESNNIPNSPDITEWYNNNIGLYPSDINIDCDHNGNYFVGLVQEGNLNKAVFHIWDLNTGHKTVEQLVPDTIYLVVNIHFSIHSSNVHMILKVTDGRHEWTIIRCLSLITLKYTDLNIQFTYVVPIVLFGDKFLLNIDNSGKNLWIWKIKSGSFTHKLSCDFVIHPATLEFVSDLVILAGNSYSECTGTVKVFNTSSLKYVCEFTTDYRINNLLFVRSGLILVCGWMQLGIWDMATETKVQKLEYHDCLWLSPSNTKTLVENDDELSILHFW